MTKPLAPVGYVLRGIEPGDADQLAQVHVAVWKATYPGMVDQAELDALTPADRADQWGNIVAHRATAEERGIRTRCAVHTPSGEIVGMATGGPARDENAPHPMQLWSLNLLPAHHGRGIAGPLMDSVVAPGVAAYLWVAAGNARAVAFYRRHGYELDGFEQFDAHWSCREARMVRPSG